MLAGNIKCSPGRILRNIIDPHILCYIYNIFFMYHVYFTYILLKLMSRLLSKTKRKRKYLPNFLKDWNFSYHFVLFPKIFILSPTARGYFFIYFYLLCRYKWSQLTIFYTWFSFSQLKLIDFHIFLFSHLFNFCRYSVTSILRTVFSISVNTR